MTTFGWSTGVAEIKRILSLVELDADCRDTLWNLALKNLLIPVLPEEIDEEQLLGNGLSSTIVYLALRVPAPAPGAFAAPAPASVVGFGGLYAGAHNFGALNFGLPAPAPIGDGPFQWGFGGNQEKNLSLAGANVGSCPTKKGAMHPDK